VVVSAMRRILWEVTSAEPLKYFEHFKESKFIRRTVYWRSRRI